MDLPVEDTTGMKAAEEIQIFGSFDELIDDALRRVSAAALQAVSQRGGFNLVLSGGSTPVRLFKMFAREGSSGDLPWEQVHFFWADERSVPPNHADSNYGMARRLLLNPLSIHKENIHRIFGELPPHEAAKAYSRQLVAAASARRNLPLFDVVLLGLGEDGHTASLFPGSLFEEDSSQLAMAVVADYGDRPSNRVTLTARALSWTHHVIFLVTGASKAKAVNRALRGEKDPLLIPSQRIRPDSGTIHWLLDQDAAALLLAS